VPASAHYFGMDRDDEYRKLAGRAQVMADRAKSPLDRESWLRVAQGWLSLIRKPRRTATERFDDRVIDDGTHQEDSKESH
jgi:hypothetical protein